ncbi:unnamed protein product [Mytilus edulis]|uniref:Uncharacterized protein n=1 Tax=Mytilus edulis TaxID=6550 RepID=A0A8S3SKY8_MYTED|nr:unnamed protein product [Mytilus edulis]
MSGRGKGVRRKTRSSPYETQWDSNNPSNWTINKLKEELNKKGIRTPTGMSKQVLKQLYLENCFDGVTPLETQQTETVSDEINTDSSPESTLPITLAESVHQHRSSVSNGENENGGTDRNIAQCFAGLQETFKQLIYRDNYTHDTGRDREFNLQQWYNHAGIGNRSETSNRGNNTVLHGNTQEHASFISGPQQIIDGKDVNLASLLIPNYETPQVHSVAANGLELNISGKPDPRLNRKLTIQEFIKAFGKFKRVMSSVYPDRRAELDARREYHNRFTYKECGIVYLLETQPDVVSELIEKEVFKGFLYGPFKDPPFQKYRVSPIGIAEGKYSGKKRLILDLSSPHNDDKHLSINDLIDKQDCSMSYCSGYQNDSDALSRLQIDRFRKLVPQCGATYNEVPKQLRCNVVLNQVVNELWNSATANTTRTVYDTGFRKFETFMLLNGFQFSSLPPISEDILIYFIAHCFKILSLQYSTIKLYLCGIRKGILLIFSCQYEICAEDNHTLTISLPVIIKKDIYNCFNHCGFPTNGWRQC